MPVDQQARFYSIPPGGNTAWGDDTGGAFSYLYGLLGDTDEERVKNLNDLATVLKGTATTIRGLKGNTLEKRLAELLGASQGQVIPGGGAGAPPVEIRDLGAEGAQRLLQSLGYTR